MERKRVLIRLGKKRRSQVITLIHRQETISFLGIPLARYIDIEDSEVILRAIRTAQKDVPIDLVLHTPRRPSPSRDPDRRSPQGPSCQKDCHSAPLRHERWNSDSLCIGRDPHGPPRCPRPSSPPAGRSDRRVSGPSPPESGGEEVPGQDRR